MKSARTIIMLRGLHPAVRDRFELFINETEAEFDLTISMVQGYRTFEQQDAIYAQGRTTPGQIVTWSPAGSSYHNYGLAADLCPFKKDMSELDWKYDFSKWQAQAEKHGLGWGGNFPPGKKDADHFEYRGGYNWRDLLHKYKVGDFIEGTKYVTL